MPNCNAVPVLGDAVLPPPLVFPLVSPACTPPGVEVDAEAEGAVAGVGVGGGGACVGGGMLFGGETSAPLDTSETDTEALDVGCWERSDPVSGWDDGAFAGDC